MLENQQSVAREYSINMLAAKLQKLIKLTIFHNHNTMGIGHIGSNENEVSKCNS
jgi:hypothetical protein